MAGNFKKNWRIPLLLLALGLIPMLLGFVKLGSLSAAAISGEIPLVNDTPHHFARPIPIVLHVIPGILFTLAGPLQFAHRIRARWPRFHRISGRIYIISGTMAAGLGMWMTQFYPHYGGLLKYLAVMGFGLGFMVCMALALRAIFKRDVQRHRAWMTRAIAIGLGPGTQSLIALPIALTVGLTDWGIGAVVMSGYCLNIAVAECIVRRQQGQTRSHSQLEKNGARS